MKFNIEVDCTPEEVRRLLGLPDLNDVHDVYIDKLKNVADKGITPDMVQGLIRNWVPMGDSGMDLMKALMGGFSAGSGGKGGDKGKDKD
jgi:hypothetical protein